MVKTIVMPPIGFWADQDSVKLGVMLNPPAEIFVLVLSKWCANIFGGSKCLFMGILRRIFLFPVWARFKSEQIVGRLLHFEAAKHI